VALDSFGHSWSLFFCGSGRNKISDRFPTEPDTCLSKASELAIDSQGTYRTATPCCRVNFPTILEDIRMSIRYFERLEERVVFSVASSFEQPTECRSRRFRLHRVVAVLSDLA